MHTAEHTSARLRSAFETLVFRAEQDILAELSNPRKTSIVVNEDRKARWAAVNRLVDRGDLVVVHPVAAKLTHRPPPLGGARRERLEIRVRLPIRDDRDERI
jgi:hypothetical protein